MAKKKVKPMNAVEETRLTVPVRLDLTPNDRERLQTQARKHGLTMASCARMAVLKWLEAQEAGR
jgi:hypothetical protein